MKHPKTQYTKESEKSLRILEAKERGPKNKHVKRQEAEKRNAVWAKKSVTEQLEYLDKMFGKNKGATKQRSKINWSKINCKRGELIDKNIKGLLTPLEKEELDKLQTYADRHLQQIKPQLRKELNENN